MATIKVRECVTCGCKGRPGEDEHMQHAWWCVPAATIAKLRATLDWTGEFKEREIEDVTVPLRKCAHGKDVSLSIHECEDCSQAWAERQCPEM